MFRPQISKAPANLAQAEANHRRRTLISAAVEKLYRQRGGARIEVQLRVYDRAIEVGLLCREEELKRAQAGNLMREKGERMLMSFSENRLYGAKQLQLMDRREELLAACRETVMTALQTWEPRDEKELQAALESVFEELSDLGREVIRKRETEVAAASKEVDKLQEATDALLAAMPNPEDSLKLLDAMAKGNEEVMQQVMERQPLEWQLKWADLFTRSQQFI